MSELRSVAVIGLGLIGGSLARDLAAHGVRVLGYDRDPATLRAAQDEGVVHTALTPSLEEVAECDALVLAVPVTAAGDLLERAAPHCAHVDLVTDTGSTKRSISERAQALGLGGSFVGAHPLAGDHRSGWSAARAGLFDNATVYLCPGDDSSVAAMGLVHELWTVVGASTVTISASAHDELLAWTSHLPQATSTALWRALLDAGVSADDLGPGGRDMTRLAASNAEMWTAIALDNAQHLRVALEQLQHELAALHHALQRGDASAVRAFFEV
jgi:prephenate dehydrogenase